MIPKVIYFYNHSLSEMEHYTNNWKNINPEYHIEHYDTKRCEEFLLEHYSPLFNEIFKYISNKDIQSDFWRLCVLYKYGGVYADLCIEPLVPLTKCINSEIDFAVCSSSWGSIKFAYNPHFIMSTPNNSIIHACINWYVQKYKRRDIFNFGRWGIMKALSETLHIQSYNKRQGIYKHGEYNIQILQEFSGKNNSDIHSIFNGIRIFNNRYKGYNSFLQTPVLLDVTPMHESVTENIANQRDIISNKTISNSFLQTPVLLDVTPMREIVAGNIVNHRNFISNKTIYMTYYKQIPKKVIERWQKINPDYSIELSLDSDCISFLSEYFNDYIVNLFKAIPKGMYKADLWRLCKLYQYGGVYADVDLVPYIKIDDLDPNITFYSCLSVRGESVFQAFMVNTTQPKNPLILAFLISFLLNKPFNIDIGPTYDMYNVITYNLDCVKVMPNIQYSLNTVKICVNIGDSKCNIKIIDLYYFPNKNELKYKIQICSHNTADRFDFELKNNFLVVTRIDGKYGWGYDHSCDICIDSNESILMFSECEGALPHTEYVSHNNTKILDSRDLEYVELGGW